MSTAATDASPAAPKKSSKKLVIILVAVLVLVLAGGGGAFWFMQKKAAALTEAGDEEDGHSKAAVAPVQVAIKKDPKQLPVFLPIDPFTVNLADRDSSRYAQITITLEIDEAKTGDILKGYMPAIRNNVLLLLASKNAVDLTDHEGKLKLAKQIQREVMLPLGIEMELDEEEEEPPRQTESAKKSKKRKRMAPPAYPVRAVHFANFIVQ